MKIFFVIAHLGSGGAERVLCTLVNYLVDYTDYDISIATYNNLDPDFYFLNEKVERIKFGGHLGKNIFMKLNFRIKRVIELREIIKTNSPDIVIPLISHVNMEVIIACLGLNKKIIVAEHNQYYQIKSKLLRILRLLLYKSADKVLILTHADARIYSKYLNNFSVMPNPVYLDNKQSVLNRKKLILCAGRLNKVKQFDHVIYVFSQIIEKYPDWRLTIAGDGNELSYLQTLAKELNISDKVDFLGNVKNMGELYTSHSIFVLASKYEGFPMVLGEAMLCGMAVVSYNCPTGPSEMIEDGISGLIVEHNNKQELKNKVLSIMDDKVLMQNLGINAKKRMEKFSIEEIGKKWIDLINKL